MFTLNIRLFVVALMGLLLAACSPVRAEGVAPTPEVSDAPVGAPAVIDSVGVEIGVGSPIPVRVVIDTSFPDPCTQLAAVQVSRSAGDFVITVTTTPADPACESPMGTLPVRLEIPLNAVGLESGAYNLTVNGVSATFTYPPAAQ